MAAKKPEPAEAEAPKKKGKLLIIVGALAVVLAGGGGAAWFFLKPSGNDAAAQAKPKPAVFLPLETFTVNLLTPDSQPQFVQSAITLKLEDNETSELIKGRMPEVRNRILMVLSGKRGADLLPVSGKEKLALEIAASVKEVVAPLLPVKAAPKVEAEDEEDETDGGEQVAEGEEEKKPRRKKKTAVAKGPRIEVLFTAFMIQ